MRPAVGDHEHPPLPAADRAGQPHERARRDHAEDADAEHAQGQRHPGRGDPDGGVRAGGEQDARPQERAHEHDLVLSAHEMDVLVAGEQAVDVRHRTRTVRASAPGFL